MGRGAVRLHAEGASYLVLFGGGGPVKAAGVETDAWCACVLLAHGKAWPSCLLRPEEQCAATPGQLKAV